MYDKEILRDILLQSDCRVIDNTGHPHPPKHEVYKVISSRMQERGTRCIPSHVYNIINNDRNGFRTLVHEKYKIPFKSKRINDTTRSMNMSIESSENVSATCKPYTKKFRVVVSADAYQKMKPTLKIYNDRAYWKLATGWTDIIATRIFEQHEQYCVIAFKNNIVHPTPNAQFYAKFDGKCSECKATITGTLLKEPAPDVDVVLTVEIIDIVEQLHTGAKKRQLRGPRRIQTATRLVKERKAAATYRREEATRLKKFGGKDPPTLPSAEVIRKAKEQHLLKVHGLSFGNPALNLQHHAKNSKHAGTIRKIGLEKFYCIYWTPEQQQLYTQRCKNNPNAVFTIDATGGVVRREKPEDPAVFLYQCMIIDEQGSAPSFQMLSGDQTALMVAYFLWSILASGVPIPKNVVTDFSWAMLIALARIFGFCNDLKDYLQKCYDVAVLRREVQLLPNTYLRLDVSHVIHMVTRWKSLRGKDPPVRNFYKRCAAQAYQMFRLSTLQSFMKNVLVVSLSQYIGYTEANEPLAAEKSIQSINKIIRGTSISEEEDTKNGEDEYPEAGTDDGNAANTGWKTWAEKIYAQAKSVADKSCKGSVINGCYNPDFAKQLKTQLMPYVAIWTGVMRPHFRRGAVIATSSAVESEFADLKLRSLNGILPTRADKFVLQHIEKHLDGKVKLASNEGDLTSSSQQKSDGSKRPSKDDPDDPSETEDRPNCSPLSHIKKENFSSSFGSIPELHGTKEIFPDDAGLNLDVGLSLESSEASFSQQQCNGRERKSKLDLSDLTEIIDRPDCDASAFNRINEEKSSLSWGNISKHNCVKEMPTNGSGLESDDAQNSTVIIEGERQTSTPIDFAQWNTVEPWGGLAKTSSIDATPEKETPSPKRRRKVTCLSKTKNVTPEERLPSPKNKRKFDEYRSAAPSAAPEKRPPSPKRRRKMTALDKCEEWSYVKDIKNTRLPMLRNGLVTGVVKINDTTYNIIRTCAFDSTFQIILNGLACSKTYAEQISGSSSRFFSYVLAVLEKKKIAKEQYVKRAEILLELEMFKHKIKSYARRNEKGIIRLDADCNVGDLVSSLFVLHPSCIKNVACTCGFKTTHPCISLPVDVDILLKEGFHRMQEAIDNAQLSKRTCRKCKTVRADAIVYGSHISIELDVITDKNYTVDGSQPPRHDIDSISSKISLGGKTYILAGVIHFEAGHYIAYTKTGLYWHKYNDLLKERQGVKKKEKIKPHLFMYVISDVQSES